MFSSLAGVTALPGTHWTFRIPESAADMRINPERYVGYGSGSGNISIKSAACAQETGWPNCVQFSLRSFLLYLTLKMTCAINLVSPDFPAAWVLQHCQGDVVWFPSVWGTQVTHGTDCVQGCWLFCLAILPCPGGLACPNCSEHSYWT